MVQFSKYQGLGNDFILIEGRGKVLPTRVIQPDSDWIRLICDRHYGIGADGLIVVNNPQDQGNVNMRIYNSDGTEAEMCGNGIRCLVKFLIDNDDNIYNQEYRIETLAGLKIAYVEKNKKIKVDMGKPIFIPEHIPTKFTIGGSGLPEGLISIHGQELKTVSVGMGNPHAIIKVKDLKEIPFKMWGRLVETNSFFPAGTNVHFLELIDPDTIKILVWERGAGATLACGTGACASAVSSIMMGLTNNKVRVILPGGNLDIYWPGSNESVLMTGEASLVYKGTIEA